MSFSKTLLLGFAVVSLSACSSTPKFATPGDMLLGGIEKPVEAATGLSIPSLSSTSPTCVDFYANTVDFLSLPSGSFSPDGLNVPQGPSFGDQMLKTLVLGTLSGVVSGGVSALGINNGFAESALIGTASQVTYNVGSSVYDEVIGDGVPETPQVPEVAVETPSVPKLSPMQEIQKAAANIGCPAPSQSDIAALNLGE